MQLFLMIIVIFILIMCSSLVVSLNKLDEKVAKINQKNDVINKKTYNYHKKSFLTKCELNFLNKFLELEKELNVKIVPQVDLATITKRVNNTNTPNELFRNIDFGIFSNDYSKVLLLIELNDSSHNSEKAKYRDKKVRSICKEAGIKLITFYTKYPNEKSYVKNRIKENLLKE